jgi:uncharacterized protein YjbI with pentapeptide repeats
MMPENTPPKQKILPFVAKEIILADEIRKAINRQDDSLSEASKVIMKKRNSWRKRFGQWVQTGEYGWNEKKPWDYLQLLLVPLALFIAASWFQWFTKQQEQLSSDNKAKQERQFADRKDKQDTLTKYLDQMSDLLQKGLLKSKQNSEIFIIAQAKTAVTLQSLDPMRQHLVIQFLESANLNELDQGKGLLFQLKTSKAQLDKADLRSAKMIGADLNFAQLSGADLIFADLRGAQLIGADLSEAKLFKINLSGAYLFDAQLIGADLRQANLKKADLSKANLSSALLVGTDLREAKLDEKQFQIKQGKDLPLLCKVALPKRIKAISDRDCRAIPKELLKRYPDEFKTLERARKYVNKMKMPKSD